MEKLVQFIINPSIPKIFPGLGNGIFFKDALFSIDFRRKRRFLVLIVGIPIEGKRDKYFETENICLLRISKLKSTMELYRRVLQSPTSIQEQQKTEGGRVPLTDSLYSNPQGDSCVLVSHKC